MEYKECSKCLCNTCTDSYCKAESCQEGCTRNNKANPVNDCHGYEEDCLSEYKEEK